MQNKANHLQSYPVNHIHASLFINEFVKRNKEIESKKKDISFDEKFNHLNDTAFVSASTNSQMVEIKKYTKIYNEGVN